MTELCYYETTVRRPSYPRLEGEARADVCVVGGGLAGCSTAMHLAKLGYQVVLLESERIGFGASGRNGGQVMPGFGCELELLDKKVGKKQGSKLFQLSIDAVAYVKTLIKTHEIDADWRDGLAFLAINKSQSGDIAKKHRDLLRRFGYRTTWLEAPQARSAVGSQRYVGGMVDELSGHMNPLKFTLALAALAAQTNRVRIFESSPVTSLDDGFPGVVRTARGTVHAKHVVLCANAYVGDLDSYVDRRIMPMRTYVIATEPISDAVSPAVCRWVRPSGIAITSWITFG
jgi:gamma-glutamylputrescine oxidase